jgi:hypothetical protein
MIDDRVRYNGHDHGALTIRHRSRVAVHFAHGITHIGLMFCLSGVIVVVLNILGFLAGAIVGALTFE